MNKEILYIEDEPFFGKVIAKKLSESGFVVDIAIDGEEGLAATEKKKYDLILLDLILPKIGGFEVLEKLKADPERKDIPVVILSNLGSKEDKERAEALDARSFHIKVNTTPSEILALVEHHTSEGNKK